MGLMELWCMFPRIFLQFYQVLTNKEWWGSSILESSQVAFGPYSWCIKSGIAVWGFLVSKISLVPNFISNLHQSLVFHSTKVNHAMVFLFPPSIQATLFYFILIFSFACFFFNHSSSSMLLPNAIYLDDWKQEVVSLLSVSWYRDLQQLVKAITPNVSYITPGVQNNH